MAVVCPCITALDPHEYREQIERVSGFARRLHIDFMDGELAPTVSPPVESAWWPREISADIHLMYKRPHDHLNKIINLRPHLVIVHAEAEGHFIGIAELLHRAGIKVGVALLPQTEVSTLKPSLEHIDHVLIFSGDLGHFGGEADTRLLSKVHEVKKMKHTLEVGWDGGVSAENAAELIKAGVDVLNSGGFIQKAENPAGAYATLEALARKQI